jgi:SAM-dependent methyltransferase
VTEDAPASPAHAYHQYLEPAIFQPLLEQVMECAAPEPGDRVLDVACGTGVLARRASSLTGPSGRVTGVDLNPMMVEVARGIETHGGAPIEYLQGDACDLGFPDGSFDWAYCQQGLQFFPDRSSGVREMKRVLDVGGRVVIACWKGLDHLPLFAALTDAEEVHLGALGVGVTRDDLEAPFSLAEATEIDRLLAEAGFEEMEVVEREIQARFDDPDRFVGRMEFAYAAVVPQFAEDPSAFAAYLAAVTEDTKDIIESYRTDDQLVFPMRTNIAVAS